MIRLFAISTIILFSINVHAQVLNSEELSITSDIEGTFLQPVEVDNLPLVIIIAGSGPTDRNGNQSFMKNNMLKKLAEALYLQNIASFRYDKRTVKQIKQGKIDNTIMFDNFVEDAQAVINYFKPRFESIYVIGHSQGSLVGLLAIDNSISGFISLAGAAKPIDEVILEQIEKTAPFFTTSSKQVFDILKSGKTTTDYPPALASIFNINIQPFMQNWMLYNPQERIAQLNVPILILNGTKDLQVSVEEAQLLADAKPSAELIIIENANHLFFSIQGNDLENSKSYNESQRALDQQLVPIIVSFIEKTETEKSTIEE